MPAAALDGSGARRPHLARAVAATIMPVLVLAGCTGEQVPAATPGASATRHAGQDRLTTSSTVADVTAHPSFDGFGEVVLPHDGRIRDEEMPLDRVASLLPYHSGVEPDAVVATLNDLADRVDSGQAEQLRVYDEDEVRADPAKGSAMLFHFRGEPGAPFAVIAPGGGFSYVGTVHEGFPHAAELSDRGYHVFVLHHRTGGERVACEDLASALGVIHDRADRLDVSTHAYSLWGSSAGARMAARLGSSGPQAYGGRPLPRPAAVVTAYTGHQDHTADEPPTFAVVGSRDGIAPPTVMQRRVDDLLALGVPAELRVYPGVAHGFGLGTGTSAEGWVETAAEFWRAHS